MRELTDTELLAVEAGGEDPRMAETRSATDRHVTELKAAGVTDPEALRLAKIAFLIGEMKSLGEQSPTIGKILAPVVKAFDKGTS